MIRKAIKAKRRISKKKQITEDSNSNKRPENRDETKEESYAIFNVGNEKFAINLDSIKEILHTFKIMTVPHLPELFSGIVKLRGESVPVVDLQNLLKESVTEVTIKPCLITKLGDSSMGFLIDSDVSIITTEQFKLHPLPDCFTREEIEFLEGILWVDNTFVGVLKPREMVEILAQWRQENEKI
ncbi:MAG: chemotaxis protein CheW [bacterium]